MFNSILYDIYMCIIVYIHNIRCFYPYLLSRECPYAPRFGLSMSQIPWVSHYSVKGDCHDMFQVLKSVKGKTARYIYIYIHHEILCYAATPVIWGPPRPRIGFKYHQFSWRFSFESRGQGEPHNGVGHRHALLWCHMGTRGSGTGGFIEESRQQAQFGGDDHQPLGALGCFQGTS